MMTRQQETIGLRIKRNGDDATWMSRGSCTLYVDVADLWHPESNGRNQIAQDTADALYICRRCPVVDECAEYALTNDERYGIWGGLTSDQRRNTQRRQIRNDVAHRGSTNQHR